MSRPIAPCAQPKGSELLLTLLVTAAALAAVLNLSTVIITGLSGSTLSASSVKLYYQAESGIERALYRVRQLKVPPSELGMGTGSNCDCGGACAAISGCAVTEHYPTSPVLAFQPLAQDQSVQVDLFDTDVTAHPNDGNCSFDAVTGSVSPAACLDNLTVACSDVGGVPLGSLVVTVTRVGDTTVWGGMQGTSVQYVITCAGSRDIPLQPSASYVVKLRAVNSAIDVTTVRATYLGLANQAVIASRLELTSLVGNFFSSQEIKVALPNRPAVSGIFDAVLYSECGINKKTPLALPGDQSCPTP